MKAKLPLAVILAGLAFASAAFASTYQFTAMTIGTTSALSLSGPTGIARDHQGNLYVADMLTHFTGAGVIYKISADRSSYSTFVSGLTSPGSIACDSHNNIYVADQYSYTVKKITPDGIVSVYAGREGVLGDTNGNRTSALFMGPQLVAVGIDDSVYVFDGKVKRIDANGNVTSMAGSSHLENGLPVVDTGFVDGTGSSARFSPVPKGMAVDPFGNVFLADNGSLRKVTQDGVVSTPFKSAVQETGLCMDALGHMYITTTSSNYIYKFNPDGTWEKAVDSCAPYTNLGAILADPTGTLIAVNNSSSPGKVVTVGTLTSPVNTNGVIINLSARGMTGKDSNMFIAGVVPSGQVDVLARAAGPALTTFNVANPVQKPVLEEHNSSGAAVASNSAWDSSLAPTFTRLGAFGFPAGSNDAAMLLTLTGQTTMWAYAKDGVDGDAVLEIYDASQSPSLSVPHLMNISARDRVIPGHPLIDGLVIANGYRKVLVRAVGPGLAAWGVSGVLPDPIVTIYDGNNQPVTANARWSGEVTVQAAMSQTGAFGLPADSADSALVVTLPPGSYTAVVTSQSGASGVALVEIYEVQ